MQDTCNVKTDGLKITQDESHVQLKNSYSGNLQCTRRISDTCNGETAIESFSKIKVVVVVVVYIFRHFNHYIFTELKNNDEEKISSGTTGTGVSQKDLQISEKTKEEEKC